MPSHNITYISVSGNLAVFIDGPFLHRCTLLVCLSHRRQTRPGHELYIYVFGNRSVSKNDYWWNLKICIIELYICATWPWTWRLSSDIITLYNTSILGLHYFTICSELAFLKTKFCRISKIYIYLIELMKYQLSSISQISNFANLKSSHNSSQN